MYYLYAALLLGVVLALVLMAATKPESHPASIYSAPRKYQRVPLTRAAEHHSTWVPEHQIRAYLCAHKTTVLTSAPATREAGGYWVTEAGRS